MKARNTRDLNVIYEEAVQELSRENVGVFRRRSSPKGFISAWKHM